MRSVPRWLAAAAGGAAKRAKAAKQPAKPSAKTETPTPTPADFGMVFNPKGLDLDAFEDDMVRCIDCLTQAEEDRAEMVRLEDQLHKAAGELIVHSDVYSSLPDKDKEWLNQSEQFIKTSNALVAQVEKRLKLLDVIIDANSKVIEEGEGEIKEVPPMEKNFSTRVADLVSAIYVSLESAPKLNEADEEDEENDEDDEEISEEDLKMMEEQLELRAKAQKVQAREKPSRNKS